MGPLTTIFAAPLECNIAIIDYAAGNAVMYAASLGVTCQTPTGGWNLGTIDRDPHCFPSGARYLDEGCGIMNSCHFSPASQCSDGWETATSGSDTSTFVGLSPDETGLMCCPR
jgi:hypothetical protein